ncbi:MAG: hypothetical protein ACI87M_000508, partial [Yoonia sp.]
TYMHLFVQVHTISQFSIYIPRKKNPIKKGKRAILRLVFG